MAFTDQNKTQPWLARHNIALQNPRGAERAIASLRSGLLEYGIQYAVEFQGCELGGDNFLGEAWLELARAYLKLLNGPTGRLDGGALDGEVRDWAKGFGFEGEV